MIDRTFCHFGPFFALLSPWWPGKSKYWENEKKKNWEILLHMCTINGNHMYGSWDMKHDGPNFLSFGAIFTL